MIRLADIFADRSISGVFLSGDKPVAQDLSRFAADHGFTSYFIEGKTVDSKERFLEVVSEAMSFPDYFGMNWDAFEDCLTDMTSFEDAEGYLILYDGFEAFAEKEPEEFDTAVEIFKEAVSFWGREGKRMIVLLRGRGLSGWDLPEISL